MSTAPPPGDELGGYRIERLIGRGGMSAVYLAEQIRLKRKVALKVLSPELAQDERFRERFIRESELAASLDHPNVLPIHEAGEQDGRLYIAMRYVDGMDLKTLLDREGPLDPDRVVTIIGQVASALDAAHAEGLVHRDVKPGNILLTRTTGSIPPEHVYLADFGLTKRAASDSGLTGTGVFAGTLNYAAPEQFEGGPLDARTDVYSLGCVLFECLTGDLPFRKEQDAALMHAHLHASAPRATTLRPDLPSAADDVVAKALAKRPSDRYQAAGALAVALRNVFSATTESRQATTRRRSRAWIAAAATFSVLVAAIAVVALTRGGEDAPLAPTETGGSSVEAQPPGSLVRVDAETGAVSLTVSDIPGLQTEDAPFRPTLAIGEGGVWLHAFDFRAFLLDLDAATGEIRERTRARGFLLGGPPDVAVGSRTVWQSGAGPDEVQRLNPLTYEYLPPVRVPSGSVTGIALGRDTLWVGSSEGALFGFDALTGDLVSQIEVDVALDELAVGQGSVWVMDRLNGEVVRIDPVEEAVGDRVRVPGDLTEIAAGDGGVWVLDRSAGTITRIDGADAPADPIRVGPSPSSIAVGLGAVWVTDEDGNLYRVDPQLRRSEAIELGNPLGPVAVDELNGAIWVGVLEPGSAF